MLCVAAALRWARRRCSRSPATTVIITAVAVVAAAVMLISVAIGHEEASHLPPRGGGSSDANAPGPSLLPPLPPTQQPTVDDVPHADAKHADVLSAVANSDDSDDDDDDDDDDDAFDSQAETSVNLNVHHDSNENVDNDTDDSADTRSHPAEPPTPSSSDHDRSAHNPPAAAPVHRTVCIMTIARSIEAVRALSDRWNNRFPVFCALAAQGGAFDKRHRLAKQEGNVYYSPALAKPTALDAALLSVSFNIACDYLFFLDAALRFHDPSTKSLTLALLNDISRKQPAVVSFPVGIRHDPTVPGDTKFCPARASAIVLHRSVVGGLLSIDTTSHALFDLGIINTLAPPIFGRHAICSSHLALQKTNAIFQQADELPSDGVRSLIGSHEVHRCPTSAPCISPPSSPPYTEKWLLARMQCAYDVTRPRISSVPLLRKALLYDQDLLARISPMLFRVFVFSDLDDAGIVDRFGSPLVAAIARVPSNLVTAFRVHIVAANKSRHATCETAAKLLQAQLGTVKVDVFVGDSASKFVMDAPGAWKPLCPEEFALFLDDHVVLSKSALAYAARMVFFYYYSGRTLDTAMVAGISLLSAGESSTSGLDSTAECSAASAVTGYQLPHQWGVVYSGRIWHAFCQWLADIQAHGTDPVLPRSPTNVWDSSASWRKYFVRFMRAHGLFVLRPNLPGGLAFATHREPASVSPTDTTVSSTLVDDSVLHESCSEWPVTPLDSVSVTDVYGNLVTSRKALAVGEKVVSSTDTCTIILVVDCSRVAEAHWREQLCKVRAWHHVDAVVLHLRSSCSLWNATDLEDRACGDTPIIVRSRLSHDFSPHESTHTECVSFMDARGEIREDLWRRMFFLWRDRMWATMVGVRSRSVLHTRDHSTSAGNAAPEGVLNIIRSSQRATLVFPPTLFLDRAYLRDMHELLKSAAIVSAARKFPICLEVLLNLLVASRAGRAPFVVDEHIDFTGPAIDVTQVGTCLTALESTTGLGIDIYPTPLDH
jgi:hypothetical protein